MFNFRWDAAYAHGYTECYCGLKLNSRCPTGFGHGFKENLIMFQLIYGYLVFYDYRV